MVWLIPAFAVWVIFLIALFSATAFREELRRLIHEVGWLVRTGLAAGGRFVNRTFYDPTAMPRREQRWHRLLMALGGYFSAIFVIGLTASAFGLGVIGTMLLMLFPGALIASRIYMALKR